jgi:DNA-binding LacI/PurR family transcriptional regulator
MTIGDGSVKFRSGLFRPTVPGMESEAFPRRSATGGSASRRRPTMEDVAVKAGVSRALVSIVFRELPGASEQTRQRVRSAAAEIGYRPDHRARLLSSKQTRMFGVTFGVGHEFHGDLLVELYEAAAQHGYELVLSGITPSRSESQAVHELLSLRCDALILLGPMASAAQLRSLGGLCPTVTVARAVAGAEVDVVRTDDVAGGILATEHLLDLGHRHIVHVDGGRAPGAAERRRGYRTAMRAAGLNDLVSIYRGGLTAEDGRRAAQQLLDARLRSEMATAVTVFNDQCAAGLLDATRAAGVAVPSELSVVGYDNSQLSQALWTQLTTIGQDAAAISRSAVSQAIAQLGSHRPAAPVLVPPTLIVRQSTSSPVR